MAIAVQNPTTKGQKQIPEMQAGIRPVPIEIKFRELPSISECRAFEQISRRLYSEISPGE